MMKGIIYDSPFTSSYNMIKSIMVNKKNYNSIVSNLTLLPMKFSISNLLGYNVLGENRPYKKTEMVTCPGMFMIAE